jgi:hypothetical protein
MLCKYTTSQTIFLLSTVYTINGAADCCCCVVEIVHFNVNLLKMFLDHCQLSLNAFGKVK